MSTLPLAVALLLLLPAFPARAAPAPPRTSPFDAIFVADGGAITVTVGGVKGTLVSVAGLDADDLADGAADRYGDDWKKRTAEDLGDAIERITGKRPDAAVEVVVDPLDGGGRRTLRATFTAEKRQGIYASDYGNGPAHAALDPRIARAFAQSIAAHMEVYWSYRRLHPEVDVEAELMRTVEGKEPPTVGDLLLGTTRLLARFPDGHAHVDNWEEAVPRRFLPASTVWLGGDRVAVLDPDGGGAPLDAAHPYLAEIDGRLLRDWLDAAGRFDATAHSGSAWRTADLLGYVGLLRAELGLPDADEVSLALADDAGAVRRVTLAVSSQEPRGRPRPWLRSKVVEPFPAGVLDLPEGYPQQMIDAMTRSYGGTRTLDGGVGYLQIKQMDDLPETLRGIADAMDKFRDAPGLVIDVRGNGGGSRLPLLALWRYLADPGEEPRVVTLAKPILGVSGRAYQSLGGSRFMYPADSPRWSDAERRAIKTFAADFAPAWEPGDAFGDWHYLVLGGDLNAKATADLPEPFHFDKPVAVLMDGDCFSATSIVLEAMKLRGDVTLVGCPAPAGSGRVVQHRISDEPRVRVTLATMASFRTDGRLFDGGLIEPGVVVWPTVSDLTGETDTQLDRAVAAVRAEGRP